MTARRLELAFLFFFAASMTALRAQAQQGDARSRMLVTPAWLSQHLHDPDVVLLHVGDDGEFKSAHIPGAQLVSLMDISVGRDDPGPILELPAPDSLRAELEKLGISDKSTVVVYFGKDWVSPATRVVFTLWAYGLGDHTVFLDGGMPAWQAAGGQVTSAITQPVAGHLTTRSYRPVVVDNQYVQRDAHAPLHLLVDARAPMYYEGPPHGSHRAGHIPGAKNIPYTSVVDDSLRLKPAAELAALFAGAGYAKGDTVIAYCHIGQQATAVIFAARSLGYPARLYDGSFDDWSKRTELPTEGGRK